ncbi:MAG: ABC transporter ATP-binding protein [Parachlamydiales bacterium]|jgi:putative ABC transport system ATP-binding protein
MENYIIECSKVKKTFFTGTQQVDALKDVNLKIKENELLMLMGPSGSGKTTLLSVIAGILLHTEGEISVLNKNLKMLTSDERTDFRGKNIGFVFQSFNLIPYLTVIENVSIPLLIQNIKKDEAETTAKNLLIKLGIGHLINRYPQELSGGEQQRVSIARGCVHNPKIILCDEPTSYLDAENGKKAMEILKKIQTENKSTLIIVTHDPRILDFADRIIEIQDGTIKNEKINSNNH